jgi:hypothetical protein
MDVCSAHETVSLVRFAELRVAQHVVQGHFCVELWDSWCFRSPLRFSCSTACELGDVRKEP